MIGNLSDTNLGDPDGDERRLLLEAQEGSRAAFTQIVDRHERAVYSYLRSRLLEPSDAQDLCQEVFIRCYMGSAKFKGMSAVRPWLIAVARNVLREHIRKAGKQREVAWTELCLRIESEAGDDEENMYQDLIEHLPRCLETLGPSARQALLLHYGEQCKMASIGQKLYRTVGAVKLLMHRARQALRRCLDSKLSGQAS